MTQTTTQLETDLVIGISRIKITVIVDDVGSRHEVQAPLQRRMEAGTCGKASAIHIAITERSTVIITVKEAQATAQEDVLVEGK
jgi:hypothetical protein